MKNINDFLKFMKNSITSFHAVEEIKNRLLKEGYKEILINEEFNLELNSKYFITKNSSSIIAFNTPNDTKKFHFQMTSAHTDSPTYKLKPNHEVQPLNYYKSLNVETYGGNIHQSWFDKPLSVAGRVFVKQDGSIKQRLVNIDKDLMVIPSMAIHLNENTNKMTYNPQVDLQPLYGTQDSLNILDIISKDNKIEKESIIDFDLFVYNRFRGTLVGYNDEFINSPQIDDLQMVYGTLMGLINSKKNNTCNVFIAFDNEEVGSNTKQGADSTFLSDTLTNIINALNIKKSNSSVINSSFMISADNAHAAHPNHPEKTDNKNACYLNSGIAIKYNSNQRYTTDGFSASIFKMICEKANVNVQSIANRSDVRGGSTLGNISTSHVSCNSVDIGLPQLAMHSSSELSGTKDLIDLIKVAQTYFDTNIIINNENVEFKQKQ